MKLNNIQICVISYIFFFYLYKLLMTSIPKWTDYIKQCGKEYKAVKAAYLASHPEEKKKPAKKKSTGTKKKKELVTFYPVPIQPQFVQPSFAPTIPALPPRQMLAPYIPKEPIKVNFPQNQRVTIPPSLLKLAKGGRRR